MRSHTRAITICLILAGPGGNSTGLFAENDAGQNKFLKLEREIDADDGWQRWVAFSPDGKSVASCGDRLVQMYDVATGRRLRQFKGSSDLKRLAFSPEGKWIATAGGDRTVHVWSVGSGEVVAVLRGHSDKIIGVSFSADGKWLASTGRQPNDGTIRIWNCSSWQEVAQAKMPQYRNSMFVAFSPDTKTVVGSGYKGGVRAYSFDGRSLNQKFTRRHDRGEMVPHVVFAKDGRSFVTSGWDKTLRAWDTGTGKEIWRATAPEYARCFEAAAISPDGKTIYCVTRDETIQSRDAKTGKLRRSFRYQDQTRGIAVSPKGSHLATVGHRGKIKVWRILDAD